MSQWTWKQAVADLALQAANERATPFFSIDDLYLKIDLLEERFPQNRHVKEKIRQTLQRLRDDGLLLFYGGGAYSINLDFEELTGEPDATLQAGFELPETKIMVRTLRLRCTLLANNIKKRYKSLCQLLPSTSVAAARFLLRRGSSSKATRDASFGTRRRGEYHRALSESSCDVRSWSSYHYSRNIRDFARGSGAFRQWHFIVC
jgi:hypothetical protein